MNEQIIKLGLKAEDFEDEIHSNIELIESVSTSARLFRKATQHIILKELRIYFRNPHLDYSDDLRVYFKHRERKKQWRQFNDSMELRIPKLRSSKLSVVAMISYFFGYMYLVLKIILVNSDFVIHWALSGVGLWTILSCGLAIPLAIIYHLGQTALPAESIDELIDKIIKENIQRLLTSDREELKELLKAELMKR